MYTYNNFSDSFPKIGYYNILLHSRSLLIYFINSCGLPAQPHSSLPIPFPLLKI